MTIIPTQIDIRPALPEVLNNVDYRRREVELKQMDNILNLSGIESEFAQAWIEKWLSGSSDGGAATNQIAFQITRARRALRCVILMLLLGETYRGMSRRLAECPLYQWFCELDRLGPIKVPSKSELARFVEMVDEPVLRRINELLINKAAEPIDQSGNQALEMKNEIEIKTIWMDSTALKANIHFPVDWVLLKDATVTLMKASQLIRDHGIKHRMANPEWFINKMNKLSMKMAAVRRQPESIRLRKKVFREMKCLVKTVKNHALRHRDLLEFGWQQTDWTQPQAFDVIKRIDNVLDKLPEAIEQAHQRIIRGKTVENSKKILSLYEEDIHVIVRGKASAEIEFGNSLLLAEQVDGLIVDWKLHKDKAPNDSKQVLECVERIRSAFGEEKVEAVVGDRQFDSAANTVWLEGKEIYNALCPRSKEAMKNKSKSSKFQKLQKRRAQTEARIAILKNVFLGNPIKRRGFKNRELQVAWSVISHNLWKLARKSIADEEAEALPIAA